MIYCFDIDGTICSNEIIDYTNSRSNNYVVHLINNLYDEGHTIKIFTARGAMSGIGWKEHTIKQLADWGVKYHELIMGKPHADYFIDDKAINILDFERHIKGQS